MFDQVCLIVWFGKLETNSKKASEDACIGIANAVDKGIGENKFDGFYNYCESIFT